MKQHIDWTAYTDFWYFVNERERIRQKREAGQPKPWSNSPIFQNWRFCNVFREYDKQSVLLNNELNRHQGATRQDVLFNIYAFRSFNWWDTYKVLGWQTDWNEEDAMDLLEHRPDKQLTSGAYMIRGRQGMPKYESICKTLTQIWKSIGSLTEECFWEPKLETAHRAMEDRGYWGWGDFTNYQVVLDMLMADMWHEKPVDLNSWCAFGPGAKRGLREIWPDIPLKHGWMLEACNYLLLDQAKYREPHVKELNLQDIEFCLCELQKYRRIKHGGRSKSTYNGVS